MKQYYHIYTKGLEEDIIFRDREDFVVGMNYVPISVLQAHLCMLAFVLMSNHFHFVVYAGKSEAERFIYIFKRLIGRYIASKYHVRILHKVQTSCVTVPLADDGIKRLISYVLNNPVKAGVNCLPQNYEWGSGRCYFSNIVLNGRLLSTLGVREACKVFKSKVELPSHYILNDSGYIEPSSYVDVNAVERIYRHAKSFEYYLSISNKRADKTAVGYSDALLLQILTEILEKRYESISLGELNEENLHRLIVDFRRQFNCMPKQLARIFHLPLSMIVNLLESQ